MSRSNSKEIKNQLFLNCGCVSMFNMQKYARRSLQLHHLLKYEYTKHTIIEESALVDEDNHHWLHSLELIDPYLYYLYNEMIWNNKLNFEEQKRLIK